MPAINKKRPYTGSVFDYCDGVDHDYGVPLLQNDYYILQSKDDEGWLSLEPNESENPVLFKKASRSNVIPFFTTYEKAETASKTSMGTGCVPRKIIRGEGYDFARSHSHAIIDPDMSKDDVPLNMELLSRID